MGFDLDDIFSSSALREASSKEDAEALKDVSYDPVILFPDTKDGLWSATLMARAIENMGVEARVQLQPFKSKSYGPCVKLLVGTVPSRILNDIQDVIDQNDSLYRASFSKGEKSKPYYFAVIKNESRAEPLNPIMRERLQEVLNRGKGDKARGHNKSPL